MMASEKVVPLQPVCREELKREETGRVDVINTTGFPDSSY